MDFKRAKYKNIIVNSHLDILYNLAKKENLDMEKKLYEKPLVEEVRLDDNIALVLMSDDWGGDDEERELRSVRKRPVESVDELYVNPYKQ